MIEMLGVLAIIGVLGVGGIAGYTKAMAKHKINKALEQISYIVMGIQTLYHNQTAVNNLTPDVLKKAGIIAANEKTTLNSGNPTIGTYINKPLIGSSMLIYTQTPHNTKNFYIAIYNFQEEACIALGSHDWKSIDGFYRLVITDHNGVIKLEAYANPTGSQIGFPVPIETVVQSCTINNKAYLYFNVP